MVTPVADLQSSLRESREHLFASIRGLTEEQFRATPPGGSWSIATHLAHLLRIERVYADRAGAAMREDDPFVASTRAHNDDDPGLAQHLAVPQIIHGMLNARRDLEALLANCDDRSLARAIRHETLGRMTLEQIFVKMSSHEAEHTLEVARLVKQAPFSARPSMGVPSGVPSGVIIPLAPRS